MIPALRLSIAVTGDTVTATLGDATLSRRRAQAWDRTRVAALSRSAVATLQRATHEHALADRNLDDLRHAGEELYLALLPGEIREALRDHQGPVLLELDEVLVTVPWELLFDGEQFLCRRYELGRAVTTAQTVRGLPARTVAHPLRMLVLTADPAGDLPTVHQEAAALIAAMDGHPGVRAHLIANADPDTVRRRLKEFDAVHFAGHAEHRPDCPAASSWHLQGGSLTAADVVALAGGSPLPLIVFANGCRSSHTDAWVGDDPGQVYGLCNAFLVAGVRFYVGTQWDVADGRGLAFGVRFWENLAGGLEVGAALRRARAEVAATEGEATLGWAPYVLYGDPTFAPMKLAVAPTVDRKGLVPRPGALAQRKSMPYKRVSPADVKAAAASVAARAPRRRAWPVVALAAALLLAAGAVGATLLRRGPAPPPGPPRTLALLGIGTGTSLEQGAETHAAGLESCLLAALARRGTFRLVDAARISALKRARGAELERLGQQSATQAGRELRADFVVYGEVAVVSGKPFFSIFCADAATHQVVFGDNLDGLDSRGCDALAGRLTDRLLELERRGRGE